MPYIEKCLKIDSSEANFFDTKACLLYGLNQLNESMDCYNKAINIEPDLINSYIYRARIFIKLRNNEKACTDIKIIMQLKDKDIYLHEYNDLKNYYSSHCN
ncbi:MAG: hypothetical protein K0S33_63 [Bacteroidetes bacterium]|nr:hypothetical protein [Bacteroidota bacterium]